VPEGYALVDLGGAWVMPGMIELHSHVGGTFDINDAVLQVNPGLRVHGAVVPRNSALELAVAGGVTTVLFIPGSATNVGGQGVLIKTGLDTYDEMLVRDPGSLKIAQGDNPKRWAYGMQRSLMNWSIRDIVQRGLAYARAWQTFERGEGERPERRIDLDVFRDLLAKRTQISTHTQYYHLVLSTIKILREELELDVYIDHGSFDSYYLTPLTEELGVAAVLGPREIMVPGPPRFDTDGRIEGTAAGFQAEGHTRIGFNTDAPVVPAEELFLQASMGVRYGLDDRGMTAVRGLTIVPAQVAGIDERVGSLEPGKDADLVVVSGDPLDPRHRIRRVYIEGRLVHEASAEAAW
jgi:imidazolonepropionase-like amidohydrolase